MAENKHFKSDKIIASKPKTVAAPPKQPGFTTENTMSHNVQSQPATTVIDEDVADTVPAE